MPNPAPRPRTRFAPLVLSVLAVVLGLVLGAGRTEADTSVANTASKVLLTAGVVAVVVSIIVLLVAHRRSTRRTSPPGGGGTGR